MKLIELIFLKIISWIWSENKNTAQDENEIFEYFMLDDMDD